MTDTGRMLTASDPEPPPCTLVRDACGIEWARDDEGSTQSWVRVQGDSGSDPESWTKVAGNYGPVTVIERGEDE
ncbi:hypothetical protein ACFXKC_40730 [Streptomyces sp. NPDC059340]|uniref:hypothetical protein n=1 Tax=Streptomyces sp. NPDC059340 TaxID=3346806 RepID=UPI0036BEDCEC